MAEQTDWGLSSDQRKSTVSRVAANIATIVFSQGQQISDSDARRAAENAERKAYTVARVEAKTTTGVRPHSETYEAYTRCLEYADLHPVLTLPNVMPNSFCCRKLAALVLQAVTEGSRQAQTATQNGTTESHVSCPLKMFMKQQQQQHRCHTRSKVLKLLISHLYRQLT